MIINTAFNRQYFPSAADDQNIENALLFSGHRLTFNQISYMAVEGNGAAGHHSSFIPFSSLCNENCTDNNDH